jgi:superfamily II DNA or RNA helicase
MSIRTGPVDIREPLRHPRETGAREATDRAGRTRSRQEHRRQGVASVRRVLCWFAVAAAASRRFKTGCLLSGSGRTVLTTAFFEEHLGELRLVWPTSPDEPALRAAQLGALMSLAGHLQTSDEAAQAVIPTGVGKTAVLCGLPFLVPTKRALVVVPTRLLRDQIHDEFRSLSILKRVGALSDDFPTPTACRVDHRLATVEAWEALESFDVVIGTPAVLSHLIEGVAEPPKDLFDLLLFDEAHHLPATTWEGIHSHHKQRSALVTATPFRRDRKQLPGTVVYHYTLRKAIADGVYSPVGFVPVDHGGDSDQAIANRAIERLRDDAHRQDGSLLLVRTDRVAHARELVGLYAQDGVRLGLITAQQSARTVRQTVSALRDGTLDGVASVGALVEGFDLPKLKIAAYHRPHRSLSPTLQFVGRIARVTGGVAGAELVAVRQAVSSETSELYREDVAWAQLLPDLADAAVLRERERRRYLTEADVKGPEELSASALAPRRFVQVFDTASCAAIDLRSDVSHLSYGRVVFRFSDADGELLAVVTERRVRPDWIKSDVLDYFEHHLVLAVHDGDRQLLFVSAPSVSVASQVRKQVGAQDARLIAPQLVARYLWASRVSSYSSVGMSSTRAASRQAAYRMLAGSAVERAVSLAESRGYGLGHVIGLRQDGTDVHGMGVSVKKSKIWDTAPAESLLEFREWCHELARSIRTATDEATAAPNLQLRLPEQLESFPANPIAAFLHNRLVRGGIRVATEEGDIDLASIQLAVEPTSDGLRLAFGHDGGDLWAGLLRTNGAIETLTDTGSVTLRPGEELTVEAALTDYPPTIYYANGSCTSGAVLFEPVQELPLPDEIFSIWNWSVTEITNEAGAAAKEGWLNVQERTIAYALEELDDPIVIVDHGAYEIADVVAVETAAGLRRIHLFHCKASSEEEPGARLADLYEVVGQGVRSAYWSSPRLLWQELLRRVRDRTGLDTPGHEKEEVEGFLTATVDEAAETEVVVWIVQPGLSQARVDGWIAGRTLLANALDWCQEMPAALMLATSA